MSTKQEPKPNLLEVIGDEFAITRGSPTPLGASAQKSGINFAIFSKHATSVTLVLFISGEHEPVAEIPLDRDLNQTGDIWHIFIHGLEPEIRYCFRANRQANKNEKVHRFNKSHLLLDPYAKAFSGASKWGQTYQRNGSSKPTRSQNLRRALVVEDDFDWQNDQPLNIPLADSIIYELHVRGFTRHPSSKVKYPGTFAGLIEKIPYLKDLGITAVELLPINEFEEIEGYRFSPKTRERLLNFWGYNSIGFFAPKASYANDSLNGNQVKEFKTLVKAMHDAGIEVILDMVFNHTAEGNERGPVYNFKGLDNSVYYIIDPETGRYHNYSGCGNTLNCNHPVVRDLILDCLRYWVTEMHVDGFRFDLASIFGRGQDGSVLANPPLIERIAHDPTLANTKLIAEAWDAAGLYQVGSFPAWGRWAEWNGKFRDDIRSFVIGEPGMVSALTKRLSGSADLYQGSGRAPYHSINFITSHDGFTLADLVSYNKKHNQENGESNRDGSDHNLSWNCGHEGPSDSEEINSLRLRQTKNLAALNLLSHGVPMILAGDEFGRTQRGNSNAYCQDNEISWLNWHAPEVHYGLLRFLKLLIQFRRQHPNLRRMSFAQDEEQPPVISWHGVQLRDPDFSHDSRSIAMHIHSNSTDNDLFLIANAYWEALTFELPKLDQPWVRVLDTRLPSPDDIAEINKEIKLPQQASCQIHSRSVVLLMAK